MADKYREITRVILKDLLKSDIEASALVSTQGEMIEIVKASKISDEKISTFSA